VSLFASCIVVISFYIIFFVYILTPKDAVAARGLYCYNIHLIAEPNSPFSLLGQAIRRKDNQPVEKREFGLLFRPL